MIPDRFSLFKCPKLIDRSGRNLIALRLVNRKEFSGHNCLIDGSLSRYDYAINRYGFSRKYPDQLSNLYLLSLLPRSDPQAVLQAA